MTAASQTLRDLGLVALSLAALAGSMAVLEAARSKGEPRRPIARAIRREGSSRDLVIVVDEAPELVAIVRPVPALWGVPPLSDLKGVRRLYVLGPSEVSLTPFFARFGPAEAFHGEVRARRWNLEDAHLAHVVFDASDAVGTKLLAHREGGAAGGPCPPEDGRLACAGDPWNQVVVEPHHFDGVELRCIYAHPQADGRLVLDITNIPPARAIVGVVGIDDAGFHAGGAPVTARVEYRAEASPMIVRELVAINRRGVTPWRIDVAHRAATATISVTTPNAGARQFCFTFVATE